MRILLVNKFLRHVGGAETVYITHWRLLEEAGHMVIPFGVSHPDNPSSPYMQFWPAQIDYRRPSLSQAAGILWSGEARRKMAALLAHTRPDIAHLHNIYHQISPSILPELARAKIPIVMTLHDYKLVCPNYRLYTAGAPCTRCVASHPWHALRHKCHKDSWSASALVALETAIHRATDAYRAVDLFLAPSSFMRQMMVRAGFPEERVRLMPHCAASMANDSNANELLQGLKKPYFLFAGRLEPEKGVGLLLEAARRLSEVSFVVAGAGSLAASIAEQAATLDNVSMLGVLNAHQLATIRREARAELAPSIWYEVFGMSALEAMQLGLPVIASDIGGLRDIVLDGETGLLIPPGDIDALATAIERLQDDPSLAAKLGAAGMAYVSRHHQPEQYLARLLSIYEEAAVLRTSPGLSGGVQ